MKQRFSLILCSSFALFFLLIFWNWGKQLPTAPNISASVPGGYYDVPFLLDLTAPEEGTIYYTTDGSYPTTDSVIYTEDIFISNRSAEPNHYNAVQNVVLDWANYTPSSAPVPKGTVVRAIFVNRWGMESDVFTQTYFVGLEPPADGYTLSLIFEENDVFGADGIYVTGADYDLWYVTGQLGSAPEVNFGEKSRVPVIMEFMLHSGEICLQSGAMRIQGNSAVTLPKKRLALYADSQVGTPAVFSTQFFPDADTHSVMLKDSITDLIVSDLIDDRAVSVQKNVPVRVFLNGEYWYDTYMLERFDDQYFLNYYGIKDIILVKEGTQEKTSNRHLSTYFSDFMDWIEETDFSDQDNWELLQEKMDVQSYIDFFCINHYLCNLDWSEAANYVLWCSEKDTGEGYHDMRWRWCIYDMDNLPDAAAHFGYDQIAQINTFSARTPWINTQTNEQSLYLALRSNPQFCQQFVLSFMDIVNNNFTYCRTASVLDQYIDNFAFENHSYNWMYGFFEQRSHYVVQHLAEEFQLTGTLENLTVSCNAPEMGQIKVNTSVIDIAQGTWSGQYFSDYPITISALPNEGYEFIGWKGDVQSCQTAITVSLEDGLVLEAVFAEK